MRTVTYCAERALRYETYNLIKAFFPGCAYKEEDGFEVVSAAARGGNIGVYARLEQSGGDSYVKVMCFSDKLSFEEEEKAHDNAFIGAADVDLALGRAFWRAASPFAASRPPWGILTGIRPVKLFAGLCKDHGLTETVRIFSEDFYVDPVKNRLCESIYNTAQSSGAERRDGECSVYISIPFCPSRCAYCSFVPQDNDRHTPALISQYFELLVEEISLTLGYVKANGLTVKTVYVGGGTPGILEPGQIKRLVGLFEGLCIDEFTFELGRPETATRERYDALRGVENLRLCINPQTLNDRVLEQIGRKHTAADFLRAYEMAGSAGFDNINTDLIVGLPGDSYAGFLETLGQIADLRPASVTIHSYSKKRTSAMGSNAKNQDDCAKKDRLHDFSSHSHYKMLYESGYSPYYLYRQRDISFGAENTGWCKNGKIGLYNLYMMDELHSIYSCGAGGVSKYVSPDGRNITRFFNYKLPLEYVKRFHEMNERKLHFYRRPLEKN